MSSPTKANAKTTHANAVGDENLENEIYNELFNMDSLVTPRRPKVTNYPLLFSPSSPTPSHFPAHPLGPLNAMNGVHEDCFLRSATHSLDSGSPHPAFRSYARHPSKVMWGVPEAGVRAAEAELWNIDVEGLLEEDEIIDEPSGATAESLHEDASTEGSGEPSQREELPKDAPAPQAGSLDNEGRVQGASSSANPEIEVRDTQQEDKLVHNGKNALACPEDNVAGSSHAVDAIDGASTSTDHSRISRVATAITTKPRASRNVPALVNTAKDAIVSSTIPSAAGPSNPATHTTRVTGKVGTGRRAESSPTFVPVAVPAAPAAATASSSQQTRKTSGASAGSSKGKANIPKGAAPRTGSGACAIPTNLPSTASPLIAATGNSEAPRSYTDSATRIQYILCPLDGDIGKCEQYLPAGQENAVSTHFKLYHKSWWSSILRNAKMWCPICNKEKKKGSYHKHFARKHVNSKDSDYTPYPCADCTLGYHSQASLTRHRTNVHKKNEEEGEEDEEEHSARNGISPARDLKRRQGDADEDGDEDAGDHPPPPKRSRARSSRPL